MDRDFQQFLQANAIVIAAQHDLQFMCRVWMQAAGENRRRHRKFRNRRRCRRRIWTGGCILDRPTIGLYENLLEDLGRNNPRSYRNSNRLLQLQEHLTTTGHPTIQQHSWNQVYSILFYSILLQCLISAKADSKA